MNIIFMGTPEFALKPLKNLIDNGYNILAVVTQPDRPKGRKMEITAPPVKEFALKQGIRVLQFEKIRTDGLEALTKLRPDLIVTAAYGQILSQEILDIPKYGVINIHASLLPKYRGASPIQAALVNGDKFTGVTIMQTDIGIDTGDIIISDCLPIQKDDNTATLTDKLSGLGATLIVKAIELIKSGKVNPVPQDCDCATHCRVIKKSDTVIDWQAECADVIHNKVRAFSPMAGGQTQLKGAIFKIRETETDKDNFGINPSGYECGAIVVKDGKMYVVCLDSVIRILALQPAGKKSMSAEDYLKGRNIDTGAVLG